MDPNAVQNWGAELYPYVKSMDRFVSPGANNDTSSDLSPVANKSAGRTSYVFNGCVSGTFQTSLARPAELVTMQSRATTVRETIVLPRRFWDATGGWKGANDMDNYWVGYPFGTGGNYTYADGHAKYKQRNAAKWSDFGICERVNLAGEGKGWTAPSQVGSMRNTPQNPNYNGWQSYGACDDTQELQTTP